MLFRRERMAEIDIIFFVWITFLMTNDILLLNISCSYARFLLYLSWLFLLHAAVQYPYNYVRWLEKLCSRQPIANLIIGLGLTGLSAIGTFTNPYVIIWLFKFEKKLYWVTRRYSSQKKPSLSF